MSRKEKPPMEDDGRTIAQMNVPGMPWYMDKKQHKQKQQLNRIQMTSKERRALFLGLFTTVIPIALVFVLGFALVLLFLQWFWLR